MKLTRRDLIRLGAGASVAGMAGPWKSLLASSESLVMTTIPSTGEQVPAVGIGTNRYRGDVNSADMAPFRATLEAFFKHGGRAIDTSPNYGNSEEVLGRLLADSGLRGNSFMATKVDREDREDGLERIAGSAKRLGGVIDTPIRRWNFLSCKKQSRWRLLRSARRIRHRQPCLKKDRTYG